MTPVQSWDRKKIFFTATTIVTPLLISKQKIKICLILYLRSNKTIGWFLES